MRTIRLPEIDEEGNFTDPQIIARIREAIGAVDGGGSITITEDPDVPGTALIGA